MHILIVASVPFESMRRRQQQVAMGLAERGHTILYLNPPRPFRSLVDPGRFEMQDIGPEASTSEPQEGFAVGGLRVREVAERLYVGEKGVAPPAAGRWGWTTKSAWKHWAKEAQEAALHLCGGGQAPGFDFTLQITLVYHPALLAPLREVLAQPLIFDCVDDFPSLATSRSIAAAYEEALTEGVPNVDGLLAVNRYILESWGRLLRSGTPQTVVEHGVDLSLFAPPVREEVQEIRAALEIPAEKKIVVYMGRFDARISYEDIQTMMELELQAVFLFVGEVSPDGRAAFQRLPQARIMPVGPLRPARAAQVVAAAEVLIFPFRREPHLEAVRGLKLYEYLATGRPVVASFRRTLKAFREFIYLYATREELEEAYRTALKEPAEAPQKEQRIACAQGAAWESRVGRVEEFLHSLCRPA